MIGVSPPAEEGDDNTAAAALSSEDSYSPDKSVRVAELDLALGLSIGRNHSKVRSLFFIFGFLVFFSDEDFICI